MRSYTYASGESGGGQRQPDRRRRPSNVSRLIAMAREMAEADVTIGAFPEQVVGGYPPEDLVQWRGFLDGQRRELERFAQRDRGLADRLRARPRRRGRRAVVQLPPRSCIAAASLGFVPKEKLPTYNVFYEGAHVLARRARLALDAGGVPLGDYIFQFDFGDRRRSKSARTPGRPTGRCAAAATRAPRSSSTCRPRRIAWASTRRAARCWRRAPPTTRRCCSTPTRSAARTA